MIEAKLSPLMNIFRIDIQLLVLPHELFTLTAEGAARTDLLFFAYYRYFCIGIF